ncbi:MAG TPA: amidohydrolase family protein [bacterium]|nr:amidohydrolase family protein [bacterium]
MRTLYTAIFATLLLSFFPLNAAVTIDGEEYEVIDPHLHVGEFGAMPLGGKQFLSNFIFLGAAYLPALINDVSQPYGENIGIAGNMDIAGIDTGFLLGVYTRTVGYATNSQLETLLTDDRNDDGNGNKRFYGLASINFEGYDAPGVADTRLAALATYFDQRPDLFVGLKLAHAHMGFAFNEVLYQNVYEVAAEYQVPVLLHSGFSPFPGSEDTPEYYDPIYMEDVIARYDGLDEQGQPDANERPVTFVFAHVGQGDKQAIKHSLELAQKYPNVYFDLSALKRPFLRDINGVDIPEEDQQTDEDYDKDLGQIPYVLTLIKDMGLIDRVMFATDGPQYAGMLKSYLDAMIKGMQQVGYTTEEMHSVLAEKAKEVFFGATKKN